MLAGTITAVLLLAKLTSTPTAVAADARVIVPVDPCPPVILDGLMLNPPKVPECEFGGLMVMEDVKELADDAVMMGVVALVTAAVATANVPVEEPPGIVMLPGTEAAPLLLDRVTSPPTEGAGATSVTVPVAASPLVTVEGLIVNPPIVTCVPGAFDASIVSTAWTVLAELALIVASVFSSTVVVLTRNVPCVAPEGITRLTGRDATGSELARVTTTPVAPAGAVSVTVAFAVTPPRRLSG